MDSRLLIIGAGGHGKVVADCAEQTGRFNQIVFLDNGYPARNKHEHWDIIGTQEQLHGLIGDNDSVFVAIGNNTARQTICEDVVQAGFRLISLIHPTAVVSDYAKLAEGVLVCANATVNAFTRVGRGSIINTNANVDHDCIIGDYVHIAPGCSIAGTVSIGTGSFIGVGSAIIQNINVGENCTVGAGSTLIRSIGNAVTVVGTPAKPIKQS